MLYHLARKALFRLPPEQAHDLALASLSAGGWRLARVCVPDTPIRALGLNFPNPVGLAAGLDKNGDHIDALGGLGFGFIEVGTITPRPQPGNDRPRMFRLPEANALINRLGFNNKGVEHLQRQLASRRWDGIVGVNIGKNRDTPNARAVDDYLKCLEAVHQDCDYITVNISSPNTEGLRDLQQADPLKALLETLCERNAQLCSQAGVRRPLLVKLAPDLEDAELRLIAEVLNTVDIEGVIATNTTIGRPDVEHLEHASQAGGLSGDPLRPRAVAVLDSLNGLLDDRLCRVGVGGISSGQHAAERAAAGAELIQIYTGFIYEGPELIRQCAAHWPDAG